MSKDSFEVVGRSKLRSDELQIDSGQIRSACRDGNDASIAKTFFFSIFVEVKTTLLIVKRNSISA